MIVEDAGGVDVEPWLERHAYLVAQGGDVFPASEGVNGAVARLDAGEVIAVASDVPGSTTVRFAGREVMSSSGAAHAAMLADRPVLSLTSEQGDDGETVVRLHSPLFPGDFETAQQLLQRMADVQEAAILSWPEVYHIPTYR